jgi:hypothetical protein
MSEAASQTSVPTVQMARRALFECEGPETLIERNAGSGRLKRQIGRCLFPSSRVKPNRDQSRALAAGCRCRALPIAPSPIGKAGACGFGMGLRNGGQSAAPESLPPKSEIGDGR